MANSCNTAFISQAPKLSGTNLFDAGVSLGIGLDHDLGFPAYFGRTDPDTESETGAAAQLIGQGTILASPMVMATVIASVQQGRWWCRGWSRASTSPRPRARRRSTEAEVDRAAVDAARRGHRRQRPRARSTCPGPPVIAKTGTAEFGTGDDLQTHAWMIAAQGDLAVCVFVEIGESGSQHRRPDPRGVPARGADADEPEAEGPADRRRRSRCEAQRADPPLHGVNEGPLPISQCSLRSRRSTAKHNAAPAVMSSRPVRKWPS